MPATTIDHIPARTCFADRAAPEGFEFPACAECQSATRLDELAFGMFVRVNDPNPDNYRKQEVEKAYLGIKNNLPHLLPFAGLSARDKRSALRGKGLEKPPNMFVADIPMVAVPAAIGPHVHRYARKLAAALFYRETGRSLPTAHVLWTDFAQASDKRAMKGFTELASITPQITVGARSNLNFGDRFGYRCDFAEAPELFAALAQFGQGLVVAMMVADQEAAKKIDDNEGVRASAMFD